MPQSRGWVLVLHGYKLIRGLNAWSSMGHPSEVCHAAVGRHELYERIFLLGGGPTYKETAIDIEMGTVLKISGVPEEKIYTRGRVFHLTNVPQPLDTIEEVALMNLLQMSDEWRDLNYDAMAIHSWVPRIHNIQCAFGVKCQAIIPVHSKVPFMQARMEGLLHLASNWDPLGRDAVMGIPQRFIRRRRTAAT